MEFDLDEVLCASFTLLHRTGQISGSTGSSGLPGPAVIGFRNGLFD